MKRRLTAWDFKKSPARDSADPPALGSVTQKRTGLLRPDIVPKQENTTGTREFHNSVNLSRDEKTPSLETHTPEIKSCLTTDLLSPASVGGTDRYEEIVANGVNIYNKIRAGVNGTGSNAKHRQQGGVVLSPGKMTSQEMAPLQNTEAQLCLQAFQPALAAAGTEGPGSNKTPMRGAESQYTFDQLSPVTSNKPPNFVKKLESFVDSVHRFENERYTTRWRTTALPKEVEPVECVVNRHSVIAGRKDRCASVTYAHGDNNNNSNNDGNNLPLDLSKKKNKADGHSRRATETFEPMQAVNGTDETSSLARLEEKFGANSSILERIGAQPSAAVTHSSEPGFSSVNGPLGNCLSKRSMNSRPPGIPVTHSKGGTAVPVPSAKVQARHSSNSQTGTLSRQKTNVTEIPRTAPRCPGEMPHAVDQDTSQYVHYEPLLATACMPGALLRCRCGSVFGLLSLFMEHVRQSGHSLLGAEVSEAKSSLPSTGVLIGQHRAWAKHGYDDGVLPYIPQCVECGIYFQSLPELTIHMIQAAHYLNLVHSNAAVGHQRPSSVCSASSSLDSFDGVENSSSETGGYDIKARGANDAAMTTNSAGSQFPVQEQTMDFSWSGISADRLSAGGIRPAVVLERREYLSPRGNSKQPEHLLRIKLKRTPESQPSPDHSRLNIAAVKLEAEGRVAARYSSSSLQFGSESRSNYSSPNFQNDLEATEGGAEANLSRSAREVISYEAPGVLIKGLERGWKEDQTSTVSALVAMQDFVRRSFSSRTDFDLSAKPSSVGDKQQSIQPAQHPTSKMPWNVQKQRCLNLSPTQTQTLTQTQTRRPKRKNQPVNSRLPDTSDTSPAGAVHPKRKGTGRSRNLDYWKSLTVEGRSDCRDRTTDLLRQQRITSWQCAASELVNGLTGGATVRPSSVDGVLVHARKHLSVLQATHVRKRHHSADFQNACSTEDSLDDLTRFKFC